MEGSPEGGGSSFTDLTPNEYYVEAVDWAAANGIVLGIGDGLFAPYASVTREQVAAILERYLIYIGSNIPLTMEYRIFADEGEISDYAKNSMQTMNKLGIINGKGGNIIDPQGFATRAEVAAMLHRFTAAVE